MSLEKPVIAVVGAGAVGGYYGARLAQGGFDVHLHMRSDWKAVQERGLTIQSLDGDFELSPAQIHAHGTTSKMPPADLILVALKTTANGQLEELIRPVLKENSVILTLQNGLGNEQRLAELFGADRILGGMAFVCINRLSPGVIRHLDHGKIALAEYNRPAGERVKRIGEIFSASRVPARILEDLNAGRWEKLIWNIPFNGLGALLDQTTDRLIHSADGLVLVRGLMQEVIDAAASLGIPFSQSIIEEKIEHTQSMGAYKTSMQIDRQLGRPMEVETIIGEPFRVATINKNVTHYLGMLYHLLRQLEYGRCEQDVT